MRALEEAGSCMGREVSLQSSDVFELHEALHIRAVQLFVARGFPSQHLVESLVQRQRLV